jgi:acyl-CoA thioester hydrolase
MELEQQAWRGDTLLVQGHVRVGCVDATTLRPKRIPKRVLDCLAR